MKDSVIESPFGTYTLNHEQKIETADWLIGVRPSGWIIRMVKERDTSTVHTINSSWVPKWNTAVVKHIDFEGEHIIGTLSVNLTTHLIDISIIVPGMTHLSVGDTCEVVAQHAFVVHADQV